MKVQHEMTRYSVQPGDRIFVKGYEFLSFAKSVGRNIGKDISENLGSKCLVEVFKTASKRAIEKKEKQPVI